MSTMLAVVTPGPTLSVYENGRLVALVCLSNTAALTLIGNLVREIKL